MSLNDDERKTMVGLQMEKANRFMNQAEMVSKMQQWYLQMMKRTVKEPQVSEYQTTYTFDWN